MTLKELCELGAEATYEAVSWYIHKDPHYRLKYSFEDYLEELDICPRCGELQERGEMVYHAWDGQGYEELICPSCREDDDI